MVWDLPPSAASVHFPAMYRYLTPCSHGSAERHSIFRSPPGALQGSACRSPPGGFEALLAARLRWRFEASPSLVARSSRLGWVGGRAQSRQRRAPFGSIGNTAPLRLARGGYYRAAADRLLCSSEWFADHA